MEIVVVSTVTFFCFVSMVLVIIGTIENISKRKNKNEHGLH